MLPLHVEVVKRELMLQEKGVDGTIDYSVSVGALKQFWSTDL